MSNNFLLGQGHQLTRPIVLPRAGKEPRPPYTFEEAKRRLSPQVEQTATRIALLPDKACSRNRAVAVVTIHPQYIAKSYHPEKMLSSLGLRTVGSRPVSVSPEKWRPREAAAKAKRPDPSNAEGVELFVSGEREKFKRWADSLPGWTLRTSGADKLFEIEAVRAVSASDKVRPIQSDSEEPLLEVVLHVPDRFVIESFEAFLSTFNLKADLDRRFEAGSLCFFPLRAPRALIQEVAEFAFLRVLRGMPRLRALRPVSRAFQGLTRFSCTLPTTEPVCDDVRAVVFDGGMPDKSELDRWVVKIEGANTRDAMPDFVEHGHSVTSALLFGPLKAGVPIPRPYAAVDHVRVLDANSADPENDDLFDVLPRIQSVLDQKKYQFINLSVGPFLPVEDHDVHAWTVMLDQYLSNGKSLATVAVGNSGHLDLASGNARVQVPSDCVNALAVGAADRQGQGWRRASYSSRGPGRSPGLVKPDVLSFGGWDGEPYWLLAGNQASQAAPNFGTSFATPSVLRLALGVRAHFGEVLSPLALRTLLIHAADDCGLNRDEVGWGCVPTEMFDVVHCPEGMVRVVYEGDLTPASALRAPIPLPADIQGGKVSIRATLCFASEVDPAHPSNYTRSGIQCYFRPHSGKRGKPATEQGQPPIHAPTKPFFQSKNYTGESEAELRRDAHKWETVLNRECSFLTKSLKEPALDIYYHARDEGQAVTDADKIRYALVVTIRSKEKDLYDRVVRQFQVLTQLSPRVEIPIRT